MLYAPTPFSNNLPASPDPKGLPKRRADADHGKKPLACFGREEVIPIGPELGDNGIIEDAYPDEESHTQIGDTQFELQSRTIQG